MKLSVKDPLIIGLRNWQTDVWMNRQTDTEEYWVACTRLKTCDTENIWLIWSVIFNTVKRRRIEFVELEASGRRHPTSCKTISEDLVETMSGAREFYPKFERSNWLSFEPRRCKSRDLSRPPRFSSAVPPFSSALANRGVLSESERMNVIICIYEGEGK